MKIENYDIIILLSFLLIFSFSIGWLYSKKGNNAKKKETTSTIIEIKEIPPAPSEEKDKKEVVLPPKEEKLTFDEINSNIQKMIIFNAINNLIAFLKQACPQEMVVDIVKKIIQKPELKKKDKLHILLALALHHKDKADIKLQLLEEMTKDRSLLQDEVPILILSINKKLDTLIPHLINWNQTKEEKKQLDLEKEALLYAAKNDDLKALQSLKTQSIPITKKDASELLWTLVKSNGETTSVAFLKALGADLDYTDPKTKMTPLIQAIKNKNLKAVKQLVTHGADVEKPSENKNIGYPLQIAREIERLDIERFLREKGARD